MGETQPTSFNKIWIVIFKLWSVFFLFNPNRAKNVQIEIKLVLIEKDLVVGVGGYGLPLAFTFNVVYPFRVFRFFCWCTVLAQQHRRESGPCGWRPPWRPENYIAIIVNWLQTVQVYELFHVRQCQQYKMIRRLCCVCVCVWMGLRYRS